MTKVRVVAHRDDVESLLAIFQKEGVAELGAPSEAGLEAVASVSPHHALLARVRHAVNFLSTYEKKPGFFAQLQQGAAAVTEHELSNLYKSTDATEQIIQDIEAIQVEYATKTDRVKSLTERVEWLTDWRDLDIALADLNTAHTTTYLFEAHNQPTDAKPLGTQLEHLARERGEAVIVSLVGPLKAALTVHTSSYSAAQAAELAALLNAEIVTPVKGVKTTQEELETTQAELEAAQSELGYTIDQSYFAAEKHLQHLRLAAEILGWEEERYSLLAAGGATEQTVVLDGWVVSTARAGLEQSLKERGLAAVIQEVPLDEDEEPPVEIKNSPLIEPFEAVTRLYGMPGYRDLDPTVFLAGFFFLFFGLSLTDVGYGLTLMVLSAGLLLFTKVEGPIRMFAKLLLFVGFATVLVGMLFGGYLGIASDQLPASLQALQVFDPIGNPLPVFYLALALGVFQVMVGLVLKIYSEARNERLIAGVLDQGPWLFLFCLGILYVLVVTGYTAIVNVEQLTLLAYVGIALVIITSGRHGVGVLGKVQAAAGALYGSIGYFSDILSYSRLLALGLATTALAFAVNLIAGIVSDSIPVIGPIFAVIILIIGHVFTLAVNTLGAFIHSARLQFVEFFGKFIAGTGRAFSPLKRTYHYVSIKDD